MSESTGKSASELYQEAQQLSPDERELLTALLNQQAVDGWGNPEYRQSWLKECERREQLVREGKMQTFPADEVHRRLNRILAK